MVLVHARREKERRSPSTTYSNAASGKSGSIPRRFSGFLVAIHSERANSGSSLPHSGTSFGKPRDTEGKIHYVEDGHTVQIVRVGRSVHSVTSVCHFQTSCGTANCRCPGLCHKHDNLITVVVWQRIRWARSQHLIGDLLVPVYCIVCRRIEAISRMSMMS